MTAGSGQRTSQETPRPRDTSRLSRNDVKAIAVATVGWTVDMFDLMVILHVAGQVSAVFFPSDNPLWSLTATYASFAVSLVVRPFGSLIFGSVADRKGRRRAMMMAVLGAGAVTALMGLLPGVSVLGIAAPVAFILLRVVQGVFVGGVAASTHTIATESIPERFRGLTAGIIKGGGASLAVVVINLLVITMTETVGQAQFDAWGWRVLFVLALLGSAVNYLMVRRTPESPLWARRRAELAYERLRPGRAIFTARWRAMVVTSAAIVLTASAPYYLTTGILPTVYKTVFQLPQETASTFVIINVVGSAIVAAVCGHLSQRVGRRTVFLYAGLAGLVTIPGLYAVMWAADRPSAGMLLACGAVMVMASGATSAPLIIFLNERFPTEVRSSATAFTWNVGYGLSGMVPTLVTAVSAGVAGVIPTLIVLSFVVTAAFVVLVATAKETRGRLEGD